MTPADQSKHFACISDCVLSSNAHVHECTVQLLYVHQPLENLNTCVRLRASELLSNVNKPAPVTPMTAPEVVEVEQPQFQLHSIPIGSAQAWLAVSQEQHICRWG